MCAGVGLGCGSTSNAANLNTKFVSAHYAAIMDEGDVYPLIVLILNSDSIVIAIVVPKPDAV